MTGIDLVRVPARYLQNRSPDDYQTSEMQKYRHAYRTVDGRWHVERAYGACVGGWRVTDTTGRHTGCTCCATPSGEHIAKVPTLSAAKAFISEWDCGLPAAAEILCTVCGLGINLAFGIDTHYHCISPVR